MKNPRNLLLRIPRIAFVFLLFMFSAQATTTLQDLADLTADRIIEAASIIPPDEMTLRDVEVFRSVPGLAMTRTLDICHLLIEDGIEIDVDIFRGILLELASFRCDYTATFNNLITFLGNLTSEEDSDSSDDETNGSSGSTTLEDKSSDTDSDDSDGDITKSSDESTSEFDAYDAVLDWIDDVKMMIGEHYIPFFSPENKFNILLDGIAIQGSLKTPIALDLTLRALIEKISGYNVSYINFLISSAYSPYMPEVRGVTDLSVVCTTSSESNSDLSAPSDDVGDEEGIDVSSIRIHSEIPTPAGFVRPGVRRHTSEDNFLTLTYLVAILKPIAKIAPESLPALLFRAVYELPRTEGQTGLSRLQHAYKHIINPAAETPSDPI